MNAFAALSSIVKYEDDPERYINLALSLALLVGVVQLVLGLIRFGVVVNFLSHAVVSGFTSASALIIAFSQIKYVFGIKMPKTDFFYETVYHFFKNLGGTHGWTVLMALPTIALLLGIQIINRRKQWLIPGALIAVIIATMLSYFLQLKSHGISIVGVVPSGLPAPTVPQFSMSDLSKLFPSALSIALIGFMESISIATNIATKRGYKVDANQELVALGLVDLFSSFFRSFPVTGGFSRTAVANNAGANTPFAGVLGAIVVGLTLLFLTGVIQFLPMNTLAAIIIVACIFLIDLHIVKELWHLSKKDLISWFAAVLATLIIGVENGILIAVGVSILFIIYTISFPHRAILGRLAGSHHTFRNIKHFPDSETFEGLLIIRIDAPFFFANVERIKATFDDIETIDLEAHQEAAKEGIKKPTLAVALEKTGEVRAILMDMSGVAYMDSAGALFLKDLVKEMQKKNIELIFSNIIGPVRTMLVKAGFLALPGAENRFFWTNIDAVRHYMSEIAKDELRERLAQHHDLSSAAAVDSSSSIESMRSSSTSDIESGEPEAAEYSHLIFKTAGSTKD